MLFVTSKHVYLVIVLLTVKHILIECVDFMKVRRKYFDVPDLKTLFNDVDPSQIFAFL